jgi:cell division septum initiation protein DivIVA
MDEVYDKLDEYKEAIEELEKQVTELRIALANKRDK